MKMKDLKRFVVRSGKKPIGKWQDPKNWLTYDDAINKAKDIKNGGISIVLGKIDNTPYNLAVIDVDSVRNKDTGEVDENIQIFIEPFKHKHVSLSGYGYHCLCLVNDSLIINKGSKKKININIDVNRIENGKKKEPEIEFYIENKVIALPQNVNVDIDDIVDSTKEYKRIYNKYTISPNSDDWLESLLNGDRLIGNDESKNDYAIIGELIKKGYSKEDTIRKFKSSNHYNSKDVDHKKKCERDDYLPNLYDNLKNKIDDIDNGSISKKNNIIKLLDEYPTYKDKMGRAIIYIDFNIYVIDSKEFREKLINICHKKKIIIGRETINNIVAILNTEIKENSSSINLDVRVAQDKGGNIMYQLDQKKMVVINDNDYFITDILEPIFKRYNIHQDQVCPNNIDNSGVKFDELLKIINVNDDDRFMLKICIISLFLPNISKPILVLNAEKGTGKTTLTKIIKDLVDPSSIISGSLDKNFSDLMMKFEHSYLVCFDNIDSITSEQSNILCRACTGDAISKRAHYTNDDDFIFSYKRPMIINGINCPTNREDLLDRSILVDLKKLDNKDRLTDDYIFNMLKTNKPFILADIFKTISKAKNLKGKVSIIGKARLYDWYEWAFCIAEAIEKNGGKKFAKIFNKNVDKQNETVVNNTDLALCLKEYTKNLKINEFFEKTASQLYTELLFISSTNNYFNFPKTPSNLTKALNRLISVLEKEGILIETGIVKTDANYIRITKVKVNENE